MERIKVFVGGCLLLTPFLVCFISDSLLLSALGVVYLIVIIKLVPKKFWKRFVWVNTRLSKLLEGGK